MPQPSSSGVNQSSLCTLRNELRRAQGCRGFRVECKEDNMYLWDVWVRGPKESPYEDGVYKCSIEFPHDYPFSPPTLKFPVGFFHPNVYPDGKVCISILHPPGEDAYGYEHASERWTPAQNIESIMLSVISLLSAPNDESPANVEAAKTWRENPTEFINTCKRAARKSVEALPEGFEPVMPLEESNAATTLMFRAESGGLCCDDDEDEDGEDEDSGMAADSAPSDDCDYPKQLQQLVQMGCEVEKAKRALVEAGGNMDKATEILFSMDT